MDIKEISFFHETNIQIRFNDIDGLGHVNNATIQEYFDLGRMEYFKTAFSKDIDWRRFATIIASNKTDFTLPIFIHDRLVVKTKITSIGNKSMQLIQLITDEEGVVKVSCKSVMVGFDHNKQQSIAIPEEWRQLICIFEHNTTVL